MWFKKVQYIINLAVNSSISFNSSKIYSSLNPANFHQCRFKSNKMAERGPIYLDHNATTPLSEEAKAAMVDAIGRGWGNPSSANSAGKVSRDIMDNARLQLAAAFGAKPEEMIFMSGGTEANNSVIYSCVREFTELKKKGCHQGLSKPHVITSLVEHDATLAPLQILEQEGLIDVTRLTVNPSTGSVDIEDVLNAVQPATILVTLMLANNETGVVFDIPGIFSALEDVNSCRIEQGLPVIQRHTDAAQAIGKIPMNVAALHVDYMTIVGHKFYGPRNGALFVRDLGNPNGCPFYPTFFGGGQERGYRPGTENIVMIAGLGAAAMECSTNLHQYSEHMNQMRDLLEAKLADTFGSNNLVVHFKDSWRLPNTTNMSFKEEVCKSLSGKEILARCRRLEASTGAACHSHVTGGSRVLLSCAIDPVLVRSAIRLSVGRHTTELDINEAVQDLKQAMAPENKMAGDWVSAQ